MGCEPGEILAWLGPAIGPAAFEAGGEVRDAFMAEQAEAAAAFAPFVQRGEMAGGYLSAGPTAPRPRRRHRHLWRRILHLQRQRALLPYRRDGQTGRMASLVAGKIAEEALASGRKRLFTPW